MPLKPATQRRHLHTRRITCEGYLREDGRMVHSMLLLQVKKPEESKYPWDYYKVLAEVPGDQVFRPMKDGGCALVAGK